MPIVQKSPLLYVYSQYFNEYYSLCINILYILVYASYLIPRNNS